MKPNDRPYFLWDYDLTDAQVRQILRGDNETERIWMMSRIVERAGFSDVWKYITLKELKEWFPRLKIRSQIKQVWEHALYVWS